MCEEDARHLIDSNVILSSIYELFEHLLTSVRNYTKEAVEHLILICIVYMLFCVFIYYSVLKWKFIIFQKEIPNPKRVLVVIAHPDDECMFFGPTIVNLTKTEKCIVYLLCLSTGTNYGMGKVRKNELYNSCKVLGIDESHIIVQNHTLLPDDMEARWPIELVSDIILHQVETYGINTIITFDKHGVSRHLNHCSIYYALACLSVDKVLPVDCKVYVLETTNFIRKYWFFLDLPVSFLSSIRYILYDDEKDTVVQAMKQHVSQFLWFRKLYFFFSRFVLVNTFEEMDILEIELDLEGDD